MVGKRKRKIRKCISKVGGSCKVEGVKVDLLWVWKMDEHGKERKWKSSIWWPLSLQPLVLACECIRFSGGRIWVVPCTLSSGWCRGLNIKLQGCEWNHGNANVTAAVCMARRFHGFWIYSGQEQREREAPPCICKISKRRTHFSC